METESLPQAAKLPHVGIEVHIQHAAIGDPLIEAAPIAERLPVIGAAHHDFKFLSLAWKAANEKARELGWI